MTEHRPPPTRPDSGDAGTPGQAAHSGNRESAERGALEALRAQGFTASFLVKGGTLRLADGSRVFRPGEVTVRDYRRFEGASDPDDMSVVYAIETSDGLKGTLVDAFGVYASPGVTAFMDQVAIERAKPMP
jgi:hypothetical protein